ncbi:hypothetical protein BK138_13055 [Paenibacillus rhizosphaerae]|uniref:Amidase n=1 Tax=Paenibacillus rhizosphaerae TaxID=297318 RepID=A0A1R1EV05_9BACL|nr:hypothetical protein [Paenibacillus rhizosphaerae]OMF55589.1 hypothetical protein BK138_13055 [Paenibacillus rhizosphaerae]
MSSKYSLRSGWIAAFVVLWFAAGLFPGNEAKAEGYTKATWLWNTVLIKTEAKEMLKFSADHGVRTIYLQTNSDIPASYYKSFIKQAGALDIRVDALSGAPSWGLTSERYKITSFLDWVKAYQNGAAEDEKFQGVHVDIEPHVLPQWKSDQTSVIRQWQENVQYLTDHVREMNLPVAADIPFWLCNYTTADGTSTLSRFMISQYDAVAIMSYRDTADGIYSTAKRELEEANYLGKPAFASVETKPSSEGEFITFYEEGKAYMDSQLGKLQQLAQVNTSFAGVSVHDLDGWRSLID